MQEGRRLYWLMEADGGSSSSRRTPNSHGPDGASDRRQEGKSDRNDRSRSSSSGSNKRQVDEVFVSSDVAVSEVDSVSSVVVPLEAGSHDTLSPRAASLAFRFAQIQLDDHARTLQNLHVTHTSPPGTPPRHHASTTPSPASNPAQLQLLTQIFASMQHQLSSAPAQTAPLPHPPHDAPLSVAHPPAAVESPAVPPNPTAVAVAPAQPQSTLLPPQQPPLLPTAVDFTPPPQQPTLLPLPQPPLLPTVVNFAQQLPAPLAHTPVSPWSTLPVHGPTHSHPHSVA
ncbi:unnamed protein product [Pylaiella littoralis]